MAKLEKIAIVILIILIIVGFALRNKGFHQNHLLTFDETAYAYLALQLKENPLDYTPELAKRHLENILPGRQMPRYLDEPLFKHPPLFPWLITLSYFLKLNPFPYMSAILVPMLAGVGIVVLVFFFAKMLYDWRVALLACFFLTFDPIHWLCSEKIWMETTLTLLVFLGLFFFFRGINQPRHLLFAGVFSGLALLTKYTGLIVPIFIFLFALFYKEELLFKRDFWLSFLIASAIFSPWLICNYSFYGASFFKQILKVNDVFYRFQRYNVAVLLAVTVCLFLLILRLLAEKSSSFIKEKVDALFKGIRFLLPVAIITTSVVLLFYPSFRQGLKDMWVYSYLPSTGWVTGRFGQESWHFYFRRLLELSPIYLFSYLAAIFLSFKNNQRDALLILCAALMMLFFVLWGNYQSRYLLPVIPILLILAARFLIWLGDRLKVKPQTLKIKISEFLFLGIAGYFIIKTIIVGIRLALPNNINYF